MNDPDERESTPAEPGEDAAPLSPFDRLNALFMRWRLRQGFIDLEMSERDRFLEYLNELGAQVPPPWGQMRLPPQARIENLGAAIAAVVLDAFDEGRIGFVDPPYIRKAAWNHVRDHHFMTRHGASANGVVKSEGFEKAEDRVAPNQDPLAALQTTELRQRLFKQLNREEAYLFGWILGAGKASGELQKAANALGHKPNWSTPRWESLLKKLESIRGLEDQRSQDE
jgi:hypothetical protein